MFTGYCDETVDFLWGVRFNNERTWFNARKEDYLRYVLQPTRALGQEVHRRFTEEFPKLDLALHVSRIYRDARRLHGRGPYKDHLWFDLHVPSDVTPHPAFWFEIAPEGYSFGLGFWQATPQIMAAMRRDMDDDPKPLERLARRLERQELFALQGPAYARPKAAPSKLLEPWYNKKSLYIGCERPMDDLACSAGLVDAILEGFRFLEPYYRYLDAFCKAGLEDLG